MGGVFLDHSLPGPCSGQKTLRRCSYTEESDHMILIDVDSAPFEQVVIIDVPDSLPKKSQRPKKFRTNEWPCRNVIHIDDDETPEDNHSVGLNNLSTSTGTSSMGKYCKRGKNSTASADAGVEKHQSVKDNATPVRLSKCKRTYSGNTSTGNRYGLDTDTESDSSDYDYCELVEDSSGKVEELWRKAFSRRKMDINSHHSAFSGGSGASFINDKDDYENAGEQYVFRQNKRAYNVRPPDGEARGFTSQNKKVAGHPASENFSFHGQPTEFDQPTPVFKGEKTSNGEPGPSDLEMSDNIGYSDGKFSPIDQEDIEYSRSQVETEIASHTSSCRTDSRNFEEATCSSFKEPELSESKQLDPTAILEDMCGKINFHEAKPQEDEPLSNRQQSEDKDGKLQMQNGEALASAETCIIGNRERIKETDEYKRAMEEELASRQQALQIQAEEAQNLRRLLKRRKAESMRLLDMERRQKERIEEIRTSQKKEEENMSLKEVIRAEVILQLNQLEIKCKSMSSLLYSLGISIGGWPNPSPQQVQTSYKRALLAFHPDRASGSDIRQQVEAEEKFKLINRLKEKFP